MGRPDHPVTEGRERNWVVSGAVRCSVTSAQLTGHLNTDLPTRPTRLSSECTAQDSDYVPSAAGGKRVDGGVFVLTSLHVTKDSAAEFVSWCFESS